VASAIKLSVSGAGYASVAVPRDATQLIGMLGVAGATDALDATVYITPTQAVSSIPAGSQEVAELRSAIGTNTPPIVFSPDGIAAAGWFSVQFLDADTAHSCYLYYK
jgi:hypothetical protein